MNSIATAGRDDPPSQTKPESPVVGLAQAPEASAPQLRHWFLAVVRTPWQWLVQRQARHTLWLELRDMDDHTLVDIGIRRSRIDGFVAQTSAGPIRSQRAVGNHTGNRTPAFLQTDVEEKKAA